MRSTTAQLQSRCRGQVSSSTMISWGNYIWGWDRLIPKALYISWPDYSAYLEEYHRRNIAVVRDMADLAEACLVKEEQLVSEWKKNRMTSGEEMVLPMRKSIVLSCLIHQRARSVIVCAYLGAVLDGASRFRKSTLRDDVSGAALLCIAKEDDLTCELLRRGADPTDDYLVDQGIEIRMCALCLMNRGTSDNFVAATAAMLGMAREAEMMCAWMSKNNKPVDYYDDLIPDEIMDSRRIRYYTLNLMIEILEESSVAAAVGHKIDKEEPANRNGPGSDGDGIPADGAANSTGGGINSDALNSQSKKNIEGGEKSKRKEESLLEKLWGWERLLPLHGSVKWSDYRSYLEEYHDDSQISTCAEMCAAVVRFCVEMEEELQSKWKIRVRLSTADTLPVSTIIQSSLIKEFALSICGRGGELCVPSAIAFVCITKEADLMCELLKHGAKPSDDIVQQSSVIRVCALGIVNHLRRHQPVALVAAMVGMANGATKMCDWMKRENKLVTFSLSEPNELEDCRLIRIKALDVMTSILHEHSFPSSKMRNDAVAYE
ncbi:uncharacterized protein [Aegilops tauschii subsp. strangulata]|uniref:Uncharacterized protein n=2 Tax=Aegilops tauschii subsp. strangulata TaxID=200361 RepID=A0A453PYS2_AEGTS|nr:uncharacterized protein LOC109750787 [Aegilops tauschii subsp. strangulata]